MEPNNGSDTGAGKFPENIPIAETEQPLDRIRRFHEQQVDAITTLDELEEATAGVGKALLEFIRSDENPSDGKPPMYAPEIVGNEEQLESEMIENPRNVFSMTANGDQFVTLSSMPFGEPQIKRSYGVTISVMPVNTQSDDPEFLKIVGGMKYMQNGDDELILPRKFPNDPSVLKNYYDLFKKGVADFLETRQKYAAQAPHNSPQ